MFTRHLLPSSLTAALLLAVGASAIAGPTPSPNQIFTAENLSPTFAGGYVAYGDAINAKFSAFRSNLLPGVGSYDFEDLDGGASDKIDIVFPSSTSGTPIGASLSGGVVRNETTLGRYNTTAPTAANSNPRNFLEVQTDPTAAGGGSASGGQFTITFSSAISAFGFFGSDIGDFDGSLEMDMFLGGIKQTTLTVRDGTGGPGPGGNLLFYAFASRDVAYDKIVFRTKSPNGNDVFGFDDFWAADKDQIIGTNPVPEPASLALAGLALLAAGATRRARRSA